MSTLDNYGIQYGTGELKPAYPEGGVSDPNAVTRRRTTGNANSFVNGFTGQSPSEPGLDAQSILDLLSIQNVGAGQGSFARREGNSFLFKSISVTGGLSITSNQDNITISGTGGSGGNVPALQDYLNSSSNFPIGQRDKYLKVKADGSGIEFVDIPTSPSAGSSVKTMRLGINGVQKFDENLILEMPTGWSFDSIPALNISIKFRVPANERIKMVNGWGYQSGAGWRVFPLSSQASLQYSDSDPTLYTFQLTALVNALTEANGFVTLHFIS